MYKFEYCHMQNEFYLNGLHITRTVDGASYEGFFKLESISGFINGDGEVSMIVGGETVTFHGMSASEYDDFKEMVLNIGDEYGVEDESWKPNVEDERDWKPYVKEEWAW